MNKTDHPKELIKKNNEKGEKKDYTECPPTTSEYKTWSVWVKVTETLTMSLTSAEEVLTEPGQRKSPDVSETICHWTRNLLTEQTHTSASTQDFGQTYCMI